MQLPLGVRREAKLYLYSSVKYGPKSKLLRVGYVLAAINLTELIDSI
jgi:hypothetical protein